MIRRAGWGAVDAPLGDVMPAAATSVTAHHSWSPRVPAGASLTAELAALRSIQHHHIKTNNWKNIGYNFVISQNGTVYEGRGWTRVGSHAGTAEGNRTSIGVCFLIDGNREAPSAPALVAFRHLRKEGVRDGHLTADHTLKLHRDWKDTECPGDVAARVIRSLEPLDNRPRVLKLGMSGEDVRELQRLLGMEPRHQTGNFGVITAKAVRNFQHDNGLAVDGLVGEKTMAKLRSR